ncbi:HAD-IIB family hydrolase [Cohnella cellulosilytica]|uniref:HAD-IIB family hydrolase n=1 Tax=Cohnella cellulosilytica TaxID=986710 RepID=A0ABW2FAY2_9BACL
MQFVFDVDGTICFQGKPLSEPIVAALDVLTRQGHELIFASARPIRDLLPVLPLHMRQNAMVGGNGAFAAAEGRIVAAVRFDEVTAEAIVRLIRKYDADYLVDSTWDYAYSSRADHPIRRNLDPERLARSLPLEQMTEMVKAVFLSSSDLTGLTEELRRLPVVLYRHGTEDVVDVSPGGADKWTGLQALNVKPRGFVAFGNDANDAPMFRQAFRSVCVGDHEELLTLSTEQVPADERLIAGRIRALGEQLA